MSLYMMPCRHATAPSISSAERLSMPVASGIMIGGGGILSNGISGLGLGDGDGLGIGEGKGDGLGLGLG